MRPRAEYGGGSVRPQSKQVGDGTELKPVHHEIRV